jgi:hypothetical protein
MIAAAIRPYTSVGTISATAFLENLFQAHEKAWPMSTDGGAA